MKRICVVTTTRADFGLLCPLVDKLVKQEDFDVKIIVSGTHLVDTFGNTKEEIIASGFEKYMIEVPIIDDNNTACEIMANSIHSFEKVFIELKPDCVIVLGDRYEILSISGVCLLLNIPLVHISGGDITFGAIDDACRHAITKMSNLHFTGNEDMRNRVIQMGEDPETVFNVGEPGVENILKRKLMTLDELRISLDMPCLKEKQYVVFTYHPETLSDIEPIEQIKSLIDFVKEHDEYDYIITKANVDTGGYEINKYIEDEVKTCKNIKFIDSLGFVRYLSAVKYSAFVMGNSSSGIVEVPYLKVPTINIGNRQQGRMQTNTIVNCTLEKDSLLEALNKCKDKKFLQICNNPNYVYGDGNTSHKVVEILKDFLDNNKLTKKKIFHERS